MSVSTEVWTTGSAAALPAGPETTALGSELFSRYVTSAYGRWHMRQPLRYGAFAYERPHMLEDLGADVDPVQHMPVTAAAFLAHIALESPDDWSPVDIELGYAAGMLHDIGECTHPALGAVVGDIYQGCKTDENRHVEASVRSQLYGSIGYGVPAKYLQRIEVIIAHKDTSPIHHMNESGHDTNTYLAGLCAGDVRLELPVGDDSVRATQLQRMAKMVTTDVRAKMEGHARAFRLPALILDATAPLYDCIHSEL